jgi:hypothetical protein
VAQLRSDCRLTTAAQVPLQAKLLGRMVVDEPGVRTLFWGGVAKWPEWSGRLAAAAATSAEWDTAGGRPTKGRPANTVVRDLLSQPGVLAELQSMLDGTGWRARVASVESVSVGVARQVPAFKASVPAAVAADQRVPFNCLLWLTLERTQGR